jgi:hypothetical protein
MRTRKWMIGLPTTLIVGTLSVAVMPASASGDAARANKPKLVADYRFQGSRKSSVAGIHSLVDVGGTNKFVTVKVDGKTHEVLAFPKGSGLSLHPTSPTIPTSSYSIVVLASLQLITGWRRYVDFKNATSDTGLFNYNGALQFYNFPIPAAKPILAGVFVQIVLTRSSAGMMVGYVNGVKHFQVDDATTKYGVISASHVLRFFINDKVYPGETSAGAVARIRIYNGVLTSTDVKNLGTEP